MNVYLIRNSDGLLSTGSNYPRWSKTGKVWRSLGHVKAHLTMVGSRRSPFPYQDAEIVEFKLMDGSVVGNARQLMNKGGGDDALVG